MGMTSDTGDDSLDSGDEGMSFSRASSPAPELLEEYTTLMSSIIDTTSLPLYKAQEGDADSEDGAAEDKKGMTKAEKQNAKKKRRKERERAARMAQAVSDANAGQAVHTSGTVAAFRLFSSTPIRPVDYGEKAEVYDIPS
ncbi:hypothetical protein BCR39DRAFT_562299 [Naematelia encephala]|uniref:Uncharacterized protein n=1 Tax=Naematelia encephala TaxID=71784 RepID=A0A1Y2AJC4_9TREE|nr:hypothetical protein BCR39DRAFT_562299 [Naematelia encephala]